MLTQGMTRAEAISKYGWIVPVPFTNRTAAEAADIYVQLRADGELIDKSDIYIAGTARSLGVPLVANDEHLAAIDDLDFETYRE
jgi:predicted nucleic acid-binding protein